MQSIDQARQRANLQFLAEGKEFSFGNALDCPWPVAQMVELGARTPGVEAVFESGLTAVVYKLRVGSRCCAVKKARAVCLVQNADGQTSFLNELQRHAEIRALRLAGTRLDGVIAPVYGSLQNGLLVSDWIEGHPLASFDERQLTQLFQTGRELVENGFFEWDFSPGNVIDDGQRVWVFDFGYMYRFDPLSQFNSAGQGNDVPMFHLAERIETRNVFAWLLDVEQQQGPPVALERFRMVKRVALDCYRQLRASLARRKANAPVLDWLDSIIATWDRGLGEDLAALYFKEGWRSHALDLDDDLRGRTCTRRTLARADWLIGVARDSYAALRASGALFGADADLPHDQLVSTYRRHRAVAERHLVGEASDAARSAPALDTPG
jgi:hypothetical protein